jgi:hypothetical protein
MAKTSRPTGTPSAPVVSGLTAAPGAAPRASVPYAEPDSLAELLGDCRSMARDWAPAPADRDPAADAAASGGAGLRGVTVPAATAHVVAGMAEYGG